MAKVYTFTRRGNKHPWLIYDENGNGQIIATLKVTTEEFWEMLGKALNIKFVFPEEGQRKRGSRIDG